MSAFSSSLLFLIDTIGGLYIMAVLLRFLLQLVRADFYNPISQAIVKITAPLLNPLRKIIPGFGGVDMASLILALLLQMVLLFVMLSMQGYSVSSQLLPAIVTRSLIEIALNVLNIYTFSLVIIAIASWVAPQSYNPGLMLLYQLTEPLSRRVRSIIPPMGGLDFSLMILVLAIMMLKNFLIQLM